MEDSEVLEMISNQQLINALWRTYEEANNILNNTCLSYPAKSNACFDRRLKYAFKKMNL